MAIIGQSGYSLGQQILAPVPYQTCAVPCAHMVRPARRHGRRPGGCSCQHKRTGCAHGTRRREAQAPTRWVRLLGQTPTRCNPHTRWAHALAQVHPVRTGSVRAAQASCEGAIRAHPVRGTYPVERRSSQAPTRCVRVPAQAHRVGTGSLQGLGFRFHPPCNPLAAARNLFKEAASPQFLLSRRGSGRGVARGAGDPLHGGRRSTWTATRPLFAEKKRFCNCI